jgi:hypothetical protein
VDNTADPKGMLVAPSLWGLSHDDVPPFRQKADAAEGGGNDAQSPDPENEAEYGGRVNSVTFIERDDPFRLHKAGFKPLEQMSKNAWVNLPTAARSTFTDFERGTSQSSCRRLHAEATSTY